MTQRIAPLQAIKGSVNLFSFTFAKVGWNRDVVNYVAPIFFFGILGRFILIGKEVYSMINVELKGGVVNQYEENITPAEIAKSIGM